jgi:hypothetical protein
LYEDPRRWRRMMKTTLAKWLIRLGRKLLLSTKLSSLNDGTTIVYAGGTKGVLLPSGGQWYFRVYHEDKSFTDHRIKHSDLSVVIDEDYEASFYYSLGQEPILDHDPEVLGYKTTRIRS